MSREIKYLSLQKTELEYEVEIRGEVPADNVKDLRKQIIKQIISMPAEDILESHLEPSDDIKGAQESLSKLKNNIQVIKSKFDKSLHARSENLAHHIYHRLVRIHPESSEDITAYKACQLDLRAFYKDLNSLAPATGSHSSKNPNENLDCSPVTDISVTCDRGISTDLSKLKYDGKTCVRAFIQKIEEFTKARQISSSRILAFATEIFTGPASEVRSTVRLSCA
ncbi:hypothetical protein K1T71_015285 [Dendrolimus kikuchii]|nr:hypothetical protein K1T71_015285 [Dendrolimus kikuchii]